MKLYLVQHGAAKSESEDPARPLTEEGRQTVERVAEFLAARSIRIDRVEHSDKLRARQTAEILAARLRPAEGPLQVAGLAPNDDVEPTRARLMEASGSLMLVGHLPHLGRLVSRLLGLDANRPMVQFQMGGVVHLERDAARTWIVRWVLPPDLVVPSGRVAD
jgi:phosphohistidine phosphatase